MKNYVDAMSWADISGTPRLRELIGVDERECLDISPSHQEIERSAILVCARARQAHRNTPACEQEQYETHKRIYIC